MIPPTFVSPDTVRALQMRLAPAFAALGPRRSESEAIRALLDDWNGQLAAPVDWLTAPTALAYALALEGRLARIQGPPQTHDARAYTTGTILGAWTVGELNDLVAHVGYELEELTRAGSACSAWASADSAGYAQWMADLAKVTEAWAAAQRSAQTVLDLTPHFLWSVTPAGSSWDAVTAVSQSLTDLDRRLRQANVCAAPDYAQGPAPQASDVDLHAYNATGKVTGAIESVGSRLGDVATSPFTWLVVGVAAAAFLGSRLSR